MEFKFLQQVPAGWNSLSAKLIKTTSIMNQPYQPPAGPWYRKYLNAARGWRLGIAGQASFLIHLICTVLVVILAILLKVSLEQWCLLGLCIGGVLSAELFNSAIEQLARAIDDQYNEQIGAALDIAAGAVLLTAITAVAIGSSLFITRWLELAGN